MERGRRKEEEGCKGMKEEGEGGRREGYHYLIVFSATRCSPSS